MPQIYFHQLAPNTQLMLWHLTEPEIFFQAAAVGLRPIAHPHKRLQHLCGRYLLQCLVPNFPITHIVAEHNNKPFLPNHPYHFSISHSGNYVAAIVSTTLRVGIDVETCSHKVAAIRHKFLTVEEEVLLTASFALFTDQEKLTLAWSAKETLFKWLGESGVDFRKHLALRKIHSTTSHQLMEAEVIRSMIQPVEIGFRMVGNIMLTWLAN